MPRNGCGARRVQKRWWRFAIVRRKGHVFLDTIAGLNKALVFAVTLDCNRYRNEICATWFCTYQLTMASAEKARLHWNCISAWTIRICHFHSRWCALQWIHLLHRMETNHTSFETSVLWMNERWKLICNNWILWVPNDWTNDTYYVKKILLWKKTDCLYTIKNEKHQAMSAHYLFGSQSMFQVWRHDIDDAHAAMYAVTKSGCIRLKIVDLISFFYFFSSLSSNLFDYIVLFRMKCEPFYTNERMLTCPEWKKQLKKKNLLPFCGIFKAPKQNRYEDMEHIRHEYTNRHADCFYTMNDSRILQHIYYLYIAPDRK